MLRRVSVVTCLAAITAVGSARSGSQEATTTREGIYALDQARRGELIYRQQCSACHRDDLLGNTIDGGPPLRGLEFTTRWQGVSVETMLSQVEELMPLKEPGSLSRQEYVDVLKLYPVGERSPRRGERAPNQLGSTAADRGELRAVALK